MNLPLKRKFYLIVGPIIFIIIAAACALLFHLRTLYAILMDVESNMNELMHVEQLATSYEYESKQYYEYLLTNDRKNIVELEKSTRNSKNVLTELMKSQRDVQGSAYYKKNREIQYVMIKALDNELNQLHRVCELFEADQFKIGDSRNDIVPLMQKLSEELEILIPREEEELNDNIAFLAGYTGSPLLPGYLQEQLKYIYLNIYNVVTTQRLSKLIYRQSKEYALIMSNDGNNSTLFSVKSRANQLLDGLTKRANERDIKEEITAAEGLRRDLDSLNEIGLDIIASVKLGRREKAIDTIARELEPLSESVSEQLKKLVEREEAFVRNDFVVFKGYIDGLRLAVGAFSAIILIVGFGGPWILSRTTVGPILHIKEIADSIGSGRLEARVHVESVDEIGALARSFNQMIAALTESAGRLTRSNRALTLLSQCMQAIVQATNEASLVQEICLKIVSVGGYPSAVIAFPDRGRNNGIACWSARMIDGNCFFDESPAAGAKSLQGDSLIWEPFQTLTPCIRQIPLARAAALGFLEQASTDGFVSVAAVPLISQGQALGILNIFCDAPGTCDEEEIGLLAEIAENLAFGIVALRTDIVRKQAEEQIRASLMEKEVLLREIYHRVKNNLQVISSLLGFQEKRAKNKELVRSIRESQNRIRAIALIHEKLYQSDDLSKIDFPSYINDLLTNLFIAYEADSLRIKRDVSIDDVSFGVDTAVSLGLILNELISNSFRHAFADGKEGRLCISLGPAGEGRYKMSVSDDGPGLPEGFDFAEVQSVGLKLVKSLVRQLHGTIDLDCSEGTRFRIAFGGRIRGGKGELYGNRQHFDCGR